MYSHDMTLIHILTQGIYAALGIIAVMIAVSRYNRGDARGYLYLRKRRYAGKGRHHIATGRHYGQLLIQN